MGVAKRLGLASNTVARWWRLWRQHKPLARRRGRKRRARDRAAERAVLLEYREQPNLRVREMKRRFPTVTREQIRRIARIAKSLWAPGRYALEWREPGVMWAMDFKEPPARVEGRYRGVLVVRDLASGWTPEAAATRTLGAREVAAVLERLFRWYGAPLAIKNDNGSNLIAAEVQEVLARWRVLVLRSPVRCPSYNGGCEAGVGSISRRAEEHASADGRPGEWTCDDLESARLQANREGRPRKGRPGITPDEAWARRRRFCDEERVALEAAALHASLREWELRESSGDTRDRSVRANVERAALSRALCELDYLKIRRR